MNALTQKSNVKTMLNLVENITAMATNMMTARRSRIEPYMSKVEMLLFCGLKCHSLSMKERNIMPMVAKMVVVIMPVEGKFQS